MAFLPQIRLLLPHAEKQNTLETEIREKYDCVFHLFEKGKKRDTCRISIRRKKN